MAQKDKEKSQGVAKIKKTKKQIYDDAIKRQYDDILGIDPKEGKDTEKDKK